MEYGRNGVGEWEFCTSDDPISAGIKYNVTAIYDGQKLKLYINGEMKEEKTIGNYQITQRDDIPVMAGGNPDKGYPYKLENTSSSFYGKIYDVKIWYNKIFDDELIRRLHD